MNSTVMCYIQELPSLLKQCSTGVPCKLINCCTLTFGHPIHGDNSITWSGHKAEFHCTCIGRHLLV